MRALRGLVSLGIAAILASGREAPVQPSGPLSRAPDRVSDDGDREDRARDDRPDRADRSDDYDG